MASIGDIANNTTAAMQVVATAVGYTALFVVLYAIWKKKWTLAIIAVIVSLLCFNFPQFKKTEDLEKSKTNMQY